jgi:hypothetical protein
MMGKREFWDEWRGSFDGRPAMFIKRLFSFAGRRVDLHKFVRADDLDCFHTHPATAIRIVLWGGYVEEIHAPEGRVLHDYRTLRPGSVSIVRPELCHRIHDLLNGKVSYSLWLRGKRTAEVEIRGHCD